MTLELSVSDALRCGANVIKIPWYIAMVNYRGKKNLLFLGLKYCGNILSYCSNLMSFQGKFNIINIPIVN